MTADRDLTQADRAVIEQVQKILKLAAKTTHEGERDAANAKVQDLLVKHNLSMSTIERAQDQQSGKRTQEYVAGGFYAYQRQLWEAVADLYFCMYFTERYWTKKVVYVDRQARRGATHLDSVLSHRHRLIGRIVNVTVARETAIYLCQAIERLVQEKVKANPTERASRWAVSFRAGAAARIVQKLNEKRASLLDDERRARALREAADLAAGRPGSGLGTDLVVTIKSVEKQEHDANVDFIWGEGTSARWALEREQQAEDRRRARAERTRWAAEHPEEAAAEEEEQRKRREAEYRRASRRTGGRRGSGEAREQYDSSAFYRGYDAGDAIGLDPQMSSTQAPKGAKQITQRARFQ
jgi:hypothetical protein